MKKIITIILMAIFTIGAVHAAGWSNGTYNGQLVYTSANGVSLTQFNTLQTQVNNNVSNLLNEINNVSGSVVASNFVEVLNVSDLNTKLYQYNNTRKTFVFTCNSSTVYPLSETILWPLNLQHNLDGNGCAVLNTTNSNGFIQFEGNNDNVILRGFNITGNFLVSAQLIKTSSNPPSHNLQIIDVSVSEGNERLISYNGSITMNRVKILDSGGLVGSRSATGEYDVVLDDVLITASANQATGECYDANGHDNNARVFMDKVRCEKGSTGHAWETQGIDCNDAVCYGSNLFVEMNDTTGGQAYRLGSEHLNFGSFNNIVATGIGDGGIGIFLDGAHVLAQVIGGTVIGVNGDSECVRAIPQFGRGDATVLGIQCINTTYGINSTGAHASVRVHTGFNTFVNVTQEYVADDLTFVFANPEAEGQFKYINSTTTRDDSLQSFVIGLNLNNHSIKGSTLLDSSGSNNHATFTGTYLGNGGRTGGAIFLDQSSSNAITIPHSDSIDLTSEGTWCLWTDLHPMGTGGYFGIAKNWEKWGIELREDRVRAFARNSSGTEFVTSYETIPSGVDQFLFLCARFTGSSLDLFVNGVQERTVAFNGDLQSGAGDLYINRYGGGGYANQTVDEVLVFNTAKTDEELYNMFVKGFESRNACVLQKDVTVDTVGNVTISAYAGSGNDYACFDTNGKIFRSNTAC